MDIRQLIDKINHFENKQILNEGVVNDMTEGGNFDEQELSDVLKAFDEQVNEIGGNGIPDYDKIISALDNGDIESAMEEIVSAYSDQDGGEIRSNEYDNYLEDLESEFKFLVYSNPSGRVRPNDKSDSDTNIRPGMKVSQGTVVKVNGNTVTVKTDEWDDVTKYIYNNRKYFAGISLIPQSGDKDYQQAPFTTVYTSREIVKEYGDAALWCSGLIELALNAFDNNLWTGCDYVSLNQAHKDHHESKLIFMTKMKNFAGKYFDGDIKRLTYCMKDVYNWKKRV